MLFFFYWLDVQLRMYEWVLRKEVSTTFHSSCQSKCQAINAFIETLDHFAPSDWRICSDVLWRIFIRSDIINNVLCCGYRSGITLFLMKRCQGARVTLLLYSNRSSSWVPRRVRETTRAYVAIIICMHIHRRTTLRRNRELLLVHCSIGRN